MHLVPEAVIDSLGVIAYLSGEDTREAPAGKRRGVSVGEVHLFCYLGCLLSLYHRRPTAEWGYEFVRSQSGLPFSEAIVQALDALVRGGLVIYSSDAGHFATGVGRDALTGFASMLLARERLEVCQAACHAAITIPPTVIRDALEVEPGLRIASNRSLHSVLGAEGTRAALYDQFQTLRRLLRIEPGNLLLPALAWLTYLADTVAAMDLAKSTSTAGSDAY
jgi:hypothetical protein